MQPFARLAAASLLLVALAGCTAADDGDQGDDGTGSGSMMMGPGSFHMSMSGVPTGMVAPGSKFNVTVEGMAMMSGMHGTSDHMGAHFWNRTMSDPTANIANGTGCKHTSGEMPGSFQAECTAPGMAGTYHIYGHMRMTDGNGTMHHYWSDEQTFTVG